MEQTFVTYALVSLCFVFVFFLGGGVRGGWGGGGGGGGASVRTEERK